MTLLDYGTPATPGPRTVLRSIPAAAIEELREATAQLRNAVSRWDGREFIPEHMQREIDTRLDEALTQILRVL